MNAQKHVWMAVISLLCVLCAGAVVIVAQNAPQTPAQENAPPAPPPADPAQDPRFRLNVNVELVNVTATVRDDQGKYLDGLRLEDFQVYEDGEEQKY